MNSNTLLFSNELGWKTDKSHAMRQNVWTRLLNRKIAMDTTKYVNAGLYIRHIIIFFYINFQLTIKYQIFYSTFLIWWIVKNSNDICTSALLERERILCIKIFVEFFLLQRFLKWYEPTDVHRDFTVNCSVKKLSAGF